MNFTSNATDQLWFGPQCCPASNAKYHAWLRYKHKPTRRNKILHMAPNSLISATQRWAVNQIKTKLIFWPNQNGCSYPDIILPPQPSLTLMKLTTVSTSQSEVLKQPMELDESKALGLDSISPRVLRRCVNEVAYPLTNIQYLIIA